MLTMVTARSLTRHSGARTQVGLSPVSQVSRNNSIFENTISSRPGVLHLFQTKDQNGDNISSVNLLHVIVLINRFVK